VDTSREGFRTALEISAYSLVAVTKPALPLMSEGGSIMAMTYLGSERVFPGYNVMGVSKAALEACVRYLAADLGPQNIRVNAISAGPIKTVAAYGVQGFKDFVRAHAEHAPLRRSTTAEEVGDTAVYLASELSRGVTGRSFCG
jgi:enoyl-[acyl-carrier protein] reductase I